MRRATALFGISLFVAHALGQTPTPAVDSKPVQTTIKTSVRLVLVDVVVLHHKQPVQGLQQQSFRLFEDGQEQKISSFEEHHSSNATTIQLAPRAPLPADSYTDIPDYPSDGSVNVVLLDALNTPPGDQLQVRRQMTDYLRASKPGAPMAIFTLASRLRLLQSFTTNTSTLLQATAKAGAPQQSALLDSSSASPTSTSNNLNNLASDEAGFGAVSGAAAVAPGNAVTSLQQFAADTSAFQLDLRVRITLDAMQQLARYLHAIPGRKNLIWFSGSFPIRLEPDDSLQNTTQAARDYAQDLRLTANQLASARIALYPVDARGLMTLPTSDASYGGSANSLGPSAQGGRRGSTRSTPGGMPQMAKDNLGFMRSSAAEHASMQQLAEETGGKTTIDSNGLKEAIADAIENGADYYTIAYSPTGKSSEEKFHRLEVRVAGGSYSLEYRRGYYSDDNHSLPHGPTASLVTSATLHGAPTASEIKFNVHLSPNPATNTTPTGEAAQSLAGKTTHYAMEFSIDPHDLAMHTTPDGASHAKIELTAIAYDVNGKTLNYAEKGSSLKVSPANLEQINRSGLPMQLQIDLPSGRLSLRIAVHDLTSDRVGSTEIPLLVIPSQ